MVKDRFIHGVQRIAPDRVSKFHGPAAEWEFDKAHAIYDALAETDFRAPKPLRLDAENGRVEYEFIENRGLLQELIEQTRSTRRYLRLFRLNRSAGRLLAILHCRTAASERRMWAIPSPLTRRTTARMLEDGVCLHGDYSPVNILVLSDNRIAAIDSTPNVYFISPRTNFGPRIADIATYTAKLTWPYRLGNYAPAWLRVMKKLREDFVRSYQREARVEVDRDGLTSFEEYVPRAFAQWRSSRTMVRWAATGVCRFASSYRRLV